MHRDGWDYFQYRWDRMQSADIGVNTRDITHLQTQVMQLEQMLVYLVGKLAIGETPTLEDASIRKFLRVDGAEDPEHAAKVLVRHFESKSAPKPKIVPCPECGAGVRDLAGITDERCNWCGTQIQTAD